MSDRDDNRIYVAIDLKSFYASVECVAREEDPLTARLVVADASRTEKTICLAVSPALKKIGVPGRPRLFEVVQKAKEHGVDFIIAPPRMAEYIRVSTKIYGIYLRYVAAEDIHVYSIDEVFIDVTDYLNTYRMTAVQLAVRMIQDVLDETGITATCGVGTNLYLAKIAMDIVAKHMDADEKGVRLAKLDEMSYRRLLWEHEPLTDFWRVGRGYADKLNKAGIYTMGDIARCSIGGADDYYNEDLLYDMFGINAELLIDHAWGWEPCRISDIKAYRPETNSISTGQVLSCPYTYEKALVVIREMADSLALELVEKGLVTDQIVLHVGFDIENLTDDARRKRYKGEVKTDRYGRKVPKHAHGTQNLEMHVSSSRVLVDAVTSLYERIVDKELLVRRMTVTANHVIDEGHAVSENKYEQMSLFSETDDTGNMHIELEKEKNLQKAMLDIKRRYGKNAILKGMNYREGATAIERNSQIGGHKA